MVDAWSTTPPSPQSFPYKGTDGITQLLDQVGKQKRDLEEFRNNLLRTAGVRARPGLLSSTDFDGDGTTANLGTKGWMLGTAEGGDSFFVLNGRLVIDELDAIVAMLVSQQATLTAQQAALTATVADLAARVSSTASIATFNTGALPNDATVHWYGSDIDITVAVPTGRLLVTVGCAEASLDAGGAAVQGRCTFSIPGLVNLGDFTGRNYLTSASTGISSPLILTQSVAVPPGTYTVTGKMGAWAAGSAVAQVNFLAPFMTVQVTG